MKKDFIEYIKTEFWFNDEEVAKFEEALKRPLKKSIRINTRKISIEDFKKKVEVKWWILTPTPLWKNIFYVDRPEEQLNIALWNTPEHISGYFYVQEVAASSSPYYMSADKIDDQKYLILDMSASPGGKTTQLLEYYPESLIVANELDKSRLKWFFSNLDRMSALKAVATNYDGRFFKQIPELFDKVLLDAPCSWEGTAFKTDDALKYWNLKNIKNVAKLQSGLLEAAIKTTKQGWEIVYSTCTLNKFENEGVIEKVLKKYWEYVEIISVLEDNDFKRNWPHLDLTGWFFIAKLKKIKLLDEDKSIKPIKQNFEKLSRNEESLVKEFFENFAYDLSWKYLYKYKDEIHLTSENLNYLWDKIFLYKIWINIWNIKDNSFVPTYYAWTFEKFSKKTLLLWKDELNKLLRWEEVPHPNPLLRGEGTEGIEYIQIIYDDMPIWIAKQKWGILKSMMPTKMMRK